MQIQTDIADDPYLDLRSVSKSYRLGNGSWGRTRGTVKAVDNVDLQVFRGETLGLVGESGCGKSTLARLIMQLEQPSAGTITIDGSNPAYLSRRELVAARRHFQMIFQDPFASLNPRMTARAIIAEALRNYRVGGPEEIDGRVETLADEVGLSRHMLDSHPHALSGGQCQRIGIARAIALRPELIVADEPVSALDVSIQAQIINLLLRIQRELHLTLVLVSHDLSVVAHLADRVAVMYLGRIVELAPVDNLFRQPAHPYTQLLLSAVPRPAPKSGGQTASFSGELPSPIDPPPGCHFAPRCPLAQDICRSEAPEQRAFGDRRRVACHMAEDAVARMKKDATA